MEKQKAETAKDKIEKYINNHLKPSRLAHIQGVCSFGSSLGEIYGEDVDKIVIAGLLHDACKWLTQEESDEQVRKYSLGQEFIGNMNLAHGRIAGKWACNKFGIEDRDIINAVTYHTTGRAGMSLLEKIIYVADAVEPGRSYPEAEMLRTRARSDLDGTCLYIVLWSIESVKELGRLVHSDQYEAEKYFRRELYNEY